MYVRKHILYIYIYIHIHVCICMISISTSLSLSLFSLGHFLEPRLREEVQEERSFRPLRLQFLSGGRTHIVRCLGFPFLSSQERFL